MTTIILGAGPTGLGAAWGLKQQGARFHLYEKSSVAGGLSASVKDEQGFTWDYGGHVLYTGNEKFKKIILTALQGKYQDITRSAWIRIFEKWVPYPFQKNLHHLPVDIAVECCLGLVKGREEEGTSSRNFSGWLQKSFGEGICKHFLTPYNKKVWGVALETMDAGWIAERVPVTDLEEVLRSILTAEDNTTWGGNAGFIYPLHGGTGGLWEHFTTVCGEEISYHSPAVAIDPRRRIVRFGSGEERAYEKLFSTLPLDQLVPMIKGVSEVALKAAESLVHNSGHIIGIGVERKIETKRTWLYFPEKEIPFYRVTYLHRYSPCNVPDSEHCSSLMCEVTTYPASETPLSREEQANMIDRCIDGLITTGVLEEKDRSRIVSRFYTFLPYSYPVPDIHRDKNLQIIQDELKSLGIVSRGRFGGWCYEAGNMDHSFMMGYQWALSQYGKETENIFPDFSSQR